MCNSDTAITQITSIIALAVIALTVSAAYGYAFGELRGMVATVLVFIVGVLIGKSGGNDE